MTQVAFSLGLAGASGGIVVGLAVIVFAYTTLIGWSYYGERCVEYLFGLKAIVPYRVLWVIAIVIGIVEIYKARQGVVKDWKGNETLAPRDDAETRREVEELRERIKVLERIATDANTREARDVKAIADEIESLRSK